MMPLLDSSPVLVQYRSPKDARPCLVGRERGGGSQILQACSQNSTMRTENKSALEYLELSFKNHWNSSQSFHWAQRTSEQLLSWWV